MGVVHSLELITKLFDILNVVGATLNSGRINRACQLRLFCKTTGAAAGRELDNQDVVLRIAGQPEDAVASGAMALEELLKVVERPLHSRIVRRTKPREQESLSPGTRGVRREVADHPE